MRYVTLSLQERYTTTAWADRIRLSHATTATSGRDMYLQDYGVHFMTVVTAFGPVGKGSKVYAESTIARDEMPYGGRAINALQHRMQR